MGRNLNSSSQIANLLDNCTAGLDIKTCGSDSRGQGGSRKRRPDGLKAHTRDEEQEFRQSRMA